MQSVRSNKHSPFGGRRRLTRTLRQIMLCFVAAVLLATSIPISTEASSSYMGDGFFCLQALGKVYNNWGPSADHSGLSNSWPDIFTASKGYFYHSEGIGTTRGDVIWNSLGSAYETTGTWTAPSTGEYIFILVGGSAGGVRLACTDARATGGTGSIVVASKTITQGTTFRYEVADGNVPFIQRRSIAYDYYEDAVKGDGIEGQHNQHTTLFDASGSTVLLRAGGGTAAAMVCGDWGEPAKAAESKLGTTITDWDGTADGYTVGKAGTYAISPSFTQLSGTTHGINGEYGETANSVSLNLPLTVNLDVSNFISQYINITTGGSRPGLLLIYKKCSHDIEIIGGNATCTASGTSTERCKLCGASRTSDIAARGHDFRSIALGTSGYECRYGDSYYMSASNASANNVMNTYTGGSGYFYTYQCARCGGKAVPKPGYYHVTYKRGDTGSGNDVADNNHLITEKYTTKGSGLFSRTGYLQNGWDLHSNGGSKDYELSTQYNPLSTTPTTLYLYPVWNPITYYITYNLNNGSLERFVGSPNKTTTCSYDGTYTLWNSGTMEKTGYLMTGWTKSANSGYIDYSLGQSVKNLTATHGASVNLYPTWKPITYKVQYHAGGNPTENFVGSPVTTVNCVYDRAFNLWPYGTLTRKGYTLIGWSRTKDASVADFSLGQSVKNLTATQDDVVHLYPVWDENSYTLRYHNDVDGTYKDQPNLSYSRDYTSYLNGVDMNFVKEGYFVSYWHSADNKLKLIADPLHEVDPESAISNFSKLTDVDGAVVDVYPNWEPISYYIEYLPYNSSVKGSAPAGTNPYDVVTPMFNNVIQVSCVLGNKSFTANKSNASAVSSVRSVNAVKCIYDKECTIPDTAYTTQNSMGFSSTFMGYGLSPDAGSGCIWPGNVISRLTPQRNQVIKLYALYNEYPTISVNPPNGLSYNTNDGSESMLKQLLDASSKSAISGTALETWLLNSCISNAKDKEDGNLKGTAKVYVSYFSKETYNSIDRPTMITLTFTAEDSLGQCTSVTTYWEIYSNGKVDILVD